MDRAGHRILLDKMLEFTYTKKYTWLDLLNTIYAFRNCAITTSWTRPLVTIS